MMDIVQDADPLAADAVAPAEDRGNMILAAAAAAVAALLGAIVWAAVAYATGFSIGFLALLIGVIVGYAVRRFGRGTGKKYQILGGAFSAVGWALGTWLCDIAYLAKEVGRPFLSVLVSVPVGTSIQLAAQAAEAMDVLFLLIAVYEGYKFAGPRRPRRA